MISLIAGETHRIGQKIVQVFRPPQVGRGGVGRIRRFTEKTFMSSIKPLLPKLACHLIKAFSFPALLCSLPNQKGGVTSALPSGSKPRREPLSDVAFGEGAIADFNGTACMSGCKILQGSSRWRWRPWPPLMLPRRFPSWKASGGLSLPGTGGRGWSCSSTLILLPESVIILRCSVLFCCFSEVQQCSILNPFCTWERCMLLCGAL